MGRIGWHSRHMGVDNEQNYVAARLDISQRRKKDQVVIITSLVPLQRIHILRARSNENLVEN